MNMINNNETRNQIYRPMFSSTTISKGKNEYNRWFLAVGIINVLQNTQIYNTMSPNKWSQTHRQTHTHTHTRTRTRTRTQSPALCASTHVQCLCWHLPCLLSAVCVILIWWLLAPTAPDHGARRVPSKPSRPNQSRGCSDTRAALLHWPLTLTRNTQPVEARPRCACPFVCRLFWYGLIKKNKNIAICSGLFLVGRTYFTCEQDVILEGLRKWLLHD